MGVPRRSMALRTAVGGVYLLLTCACLAVVGVVVVGAGRRAAGVLDRDRALERAQSIREGFESTLSVGVGAARLRLREVAGLSSTSRLLDPEAERRRVELEQALALAIVGSERVTLSHTPVGGASLLFVTVPVRAEGRVVGELRVDLDVNAFARRVLRPHPSTGERWQIVTAAGSIIWDSAGQPAAGSGGGQVPVNPWGSGLSATTDGVNWHAAVRSLRYRWTYVVTTASPATVAFNSLSIPALAGFLLFLIAGAGIAGFRTASSLATPLRGITRAAALITSGDVAPKLPRCSIAEVDALASAVNAMVSTISLQRQELLRRYVQLESKNIMLERAHVDIQAKAELLEEQKGELLARSEEITTKSREIRDKNQRLGALNVDLARSNHQLNLLVCELERKDDALGRLIESEAAQAAAIIEGTADLVVVTDNQGFVNLVNPAAAQFLNRPQEDLRGAHCSEVLACRAPSGELLCGIGRSCPLARTVESSSDYYCEIVLSPPGGRPSDMGTRWSLVRDHETGRPERVVCILRDMTQQKDVERAKSDFVSSVSHELRTPLTSMRGFTYLLLRDDIQVPREEAREYLGMIDEEIGRLSRLIEDILNVSRIEAGLPVEVRRVSVRLEAILGRIVSRLESICRGRQIRIAVPEGLEVFADEDKLVQILTNLVSNAVKFSANGMAITIAASRTGNGVTASVADAGIGIAKEDLGRVFERFYRGREVKGRIGGSGLGLHITKALVEAHGGQIWVESGGIGCGSTFAFELPDQTSRLEVSGERRAG